MTKLRKICCAGTYAVALAFTLTTAAPADSFKLIELGASTVDSGLIGITSSGTVVIEQELGIPEDIVYNVYPLNAPSYVLFDPPNFVYENQTFGCTPVTSAGVTWASAYGSTSCTGSHEEYEGFYTPSGMSTTQLGIFGGPDLADLVPVPGFPAIGSNIYGAFLDSSGDFAFEYDHYYEAVDLTSAVPEPATPLLAFGGLLIVTACRFRIRN